MSIAEHPLYSTWSAMKYRCSSENHPDYQYYGGRGIDVCDRWKNSFENFAADMGKRPEGMSIDRIDNDSGYRPDNCRWATKEQQVNNRGRYPQFGGMKPDKSGRTFTGVRLSAEEKQKLDELAELDQTTNSKIIRNLINRSWKARVRVIK